MGVVADIKRLFSGKKSLAKISADELTTQKIKLEQQETQLTQQVKKLEKEKESLFREGKDKTSVTEQKIYARKIKEKDVEAKNTERNLELISKQLRLISGFSQVKKQQQLLKKLGLQNVIDWDIDELQRYIEASSVEGQFHMEKFTDMLQRLEQGGSLTQQAATDPDEEAIIREMARAKAAEAESDPETAVKESLGNVNKILSRSSDSGNE